jgi:hypothetical protein
MRKPVLKSANRIPLLGLLALAAACSSNDPPATGSGSGGAAGGGAASGSGGTASGGAPPAAGGIAPASGGSSTASGGNVATGGSFTATGGAVSKGGSSTATGGSSATGGSPASGGGGTTGGSAGVGGGGATGLARFSFFVTSLEGLRRLSGSQNGFGGNLRHGEATGLAGADKICTELAEASMPGAGQKGWRAFLSVAKGPDGNPVNAIDRIGEGPWYDRVGRVVAMNKTALLNARPQGADPAIINDLPNETGTPNHQPDPTQPAVDNHHVLTGSDTSGRLYNGNVNGTCSNWESAEATSGRPRVGFSWPAGSRMHWISGQDEGGCRAGVSVVEMGGSDPSNPIVGSGGGYGGIYCFALKQ